MATDHTAEAAVDYLEGLFNRAMSGRSVRDMPEAFGAVRAEVARLRAAAEGSENRPREGWTAREALACAYCWTEFASPENRTDNPTSYWASITERARNECRSIANERLLLAVARAQAVAIPHVAALREGQFAALKIALGMKLDHRVRAILQAVFWTLQPARMPSPPPSTTRNAP